MKRCVSRSAFTLLTIAAFVLMAVVLARDARVIAQASNRVIITAEEIVDHVTADDEGGQSISSINVTAVVHAPGGAHPTAVPGHYEMDEAHIREYIAASSDDESFRRYMQRYVLGKTEAEYQALVRGGVAVPALTR